MSQTSIGGFPDLRIVPVSSLLRHEDVDLERVARLLDRLSADGTLRNPPIVAALPESEQFLLLDGANRVSAVENMDIPHILVQVEPFEDPDLQFRHWNHVVRDIEAKDLLELAPRLEGVSVSSEPQGVAGEPVARILHPSGESLTLVTDLPLPDRIGILRRIVDIYYKREARMDRVNHEDVAALKVQHPHFGALVAYPDFDKRDIRATAEQGNKLPSGVTRILVPRRVLGFNLGLPLLKSSLPLEEKRSWLADEIQHKVSEHRVRYYQEPTFIFDD